MNCNDCSQQLSAYLDAALSGSQSGKIAQHLSVCPLCRRELGELQRVHDSLRALRTPVARDGFWDGVHSQIGATPRRRVLSWWQLLKLPYVRVPALAAVGIVLVMLVSGLISLRLDSRQGFPIQPMLAEHARYTSVQPLNDPGRMNYLEADSDVSTLDDSLILVNEYR